MGGIFGEGLAARKNEIKNPIKAILAGIFLSLLKLSIPLGDFPVSLGLMFKVLSVGASP